MEHCIYCHVNIHDSYIYDDDSETCPVDHEPMTFTSQSDGWERSRAMNETAVLRDKIARIVNPEAWKIFDMYKPDAPDFSYRDGYVKDSRITAQKILEMLENEKDSSV